MVHLNRMKCRNGAQGNEVTEPKAIQQCNPKIFALSLDPPNPPSIVIVLVLKRAGVR